MCFVSEIIIVVLIACDMDYLNNCGTSREMAGEPQDGFQQRIKSNWIIRN